MHLTGETTQQLYEPLELDFVRAGNIRAASSPRNSTVLSSSLRTGQRNKVETTRCRRQASVFVPRLKCLPLVGLSSDNEVAVLGKASINSTDPLLSNLVKAFCTLDLGSSSNDARRTGPRSGSGTQKRQPHG